MTPLPKRPITLPFPDADIDQLTRVHREVWRRIEARLRMLRLRGLSGYLWTRKLQRAQIDLGLERWHRARKEIESPLEAELKLRDRVLAIRASTKPPA